MRARRSIRAAALTLALALPLAAGQPVQAADPEPPLSGPSQTETTPSGLPVPRFVSLKFDSVNGRAGPSTDHPIRWTYTRAGLPVEVVAETEDWRKVRDPEGDLVWMHRRTLSSRRTAIVSPSPDGASPIRRRPDPAGGVVALADAGVQFELGRCLDGWCRVEGARASGWMAASQLWGVYPEEAAR